MKGINSYWTKAIFKKVSNYSCRRTFYLLENLDEKSFSDNNLIAKQVFIENLRTLVESIEKTGDIMRESRDMLAPGSIFEGYFSGQYGSLRTSYINERKKLEKQLTLIKILFDP